MAVERIESGGDGPEESDEAFPVPGVDDVRPELGVVEQVGLAIRAFRRSRGWSQRALAAELGLAQASVARLERGADGAALGTVLAVLGLIGCSLAVVDADGELVTEWDGDGPQPEWTAEGFTPPEGTRYGREPRPYEEGEGPRWPY